MPGKHLITKSYPVSGVPDENAASEILEQINDLKGVQKAAFNAEDRLVQITFDEQIAKDRDIRWLLDKHGHTIIDPEEAHFNEEALD